MKPVDVVKLLTRPRYERSKVKARSLTIQREVARRQKKTSFKELEGGTSGLRTMLFLTLFGFSSVTHAAMFYWDGKTYIPLGLQSQSETVLRMPENISNFWPEQAPSIHFNKIDDRTLSLSPTIPHVEQRVFLRGVSGKLYLAKASTEVKYLPIIEVSDVGDKSATATEARTELTTSTMLLKLMKNEIPAGFASAKSTRRIVDSDKFKIEAVEVWSSPNMTGIVTTISRATGAGTTVEINPAQIEIYIPELGQMCIIGADKWSLDDAAPSTKGYLVFTKS